VCENSFGSYKCICPDGYRLNTNTQECVGEYEYVNKDFFQPFTIIMLVVSVLHGKVFFLLLKVTDLLVKAYLFAVESRAIFINSFTQFFLFNET